MSGTFLTGGPPQHAQDSLPALPAHLQSDTHLTAHLASRFHVSLPTARLSSHAIVSLNTYTSSHKGPHGDKEGSAMASAENLASRAWTRLSQRGENQAVVFLGESGSGKTTLRSHLLSSVLSLSSTPLSTKLSYAAFVFDTLTTTKSITTPTASKAGLYFELQYDTSSSIQPTLVGGKLLDHRLERSRIASVPTGERSFHALYYLLAGTSAAEKQHLGLDSHLQGPESAGNRTSLTPTQKRWRYLGHPTQLKVGINDAEGFQHFKTALRKLEFPRGEIAEICQILACILHLGQLEFAITQSTTPAADDSGGYSHEGGESVTTVKNRDTLDTIAAFLGVSVQEMETCLGYKTRTLHKERVTVMLDPKGARDNADELARTLYTLLVAYVMESINQRTCASDEAINNTISVVDFPGFAQQSATGCTLDQLLNNAATESLYNFTLHSFFEEKANLLETEEIHVPPTSYFDNSDAVKGLLKPGNGLLSILDDQMRRGRTDMQFLESLRKRFENKNPAIEVGEATRYLPGSNFPTHNTHASFSVKHWAGEVEYPVEGMLEENGEVVSGDFLNLIRTTKSIFVKSLFGQEALQTVFHPQEKSAVLQATLSSKPARAPSMARRRGDGTRYGTRRNAGPRAFDAEDEDDSGNRQRNPSHGRKRKTDAVVTQGASAEFLSSLDNINQSLANSNTNPYFVFCLKPNDRRIANQFDSKCVRAQIQTLGVAEISQRLRNADFSIFLPFGEFLGLAEADELLVGSEINKVETILDQKRWPANEARIGSTGVLLSEACWMQMVKRPEVPATAGVTSPNLQMDRSPFADGAGINDSKSNLLAGDMGTTAFNDDKSPAYYGQGEVDTKSEAGASAFNSGDMFRNMETRQEMAEKGNEKRMEEVDTVRMTGSRKRWLTLVWLLTWYVPDFLVKWIGRIKRKDVRMAWREKYAINLLIWAACAFVVFFIVIFPELICPHQYVYSEAELSSFNGQDGADAYVAIRGVIFDLGAFAPSHYPEFIPNKELLNFAGKDITSLFPVQVSGMCPGKDGSIDKAVQLTFQSNNYTGQTVTTAANTQQAQYHDFRWAAGPDYRPTWFTEQMLYLSKDYWKGNVAYAPDYLSSLVSKEHDYIAHIHGRVYDLSSYINGGAQPQYPPGYKGSNVSIEATQYMDQSTVDLFQQNPGKDITQLWEALPLDAGLRANMQICLDNLFYAGAVDTRNSTQCLFARYILLAISILLVSVIGFKFFAALQFGSKTLPENLDKFVICTVPAYTEDEESLRRAIDSAARMRYDDKRKLLMIICDGMIIGQGNDRPTPRIVLDILGVPETIDPEPLSFESLGEGMKQHNMGKVYSGLYEVQGHIVPFLVLVKIGKPSEVSRPGNRGKRDSQMVLMRFLNRVHYNLPMTPLELEMHHQIRNIIGVNPTFYEFLLQIDADTVVAPDSATRMVSAFINDTRLIGVCGETALTNAKTSLVTMIQVYEYYISHNLTKAFESLFGSVTCLPGCFTMYRIRAAETGKPLFVSREVVEAYSALRVDTLHMKNLLHLGEDRYLTTLLIKFHSKYKTKYIFRAHAWTIAPDSWKVFLSQRRRWINSTVHNLMELIPLQQLCGFCCFSMRFVVFLDLLSTIVQPVIIGYLVYLVIVLARSSSAVPITAVILLAAIYGLQAIIFILRRKWEMIGWMIIYIIATPIFSCALPLYAFWHMDDFSWGTTRVVTGEGGRQVVVSDEGKFDPRSIPRKRWEEYQAELWDAQTQTNVDDFDDTRSQMSGISYATKSAWGVKSDYGPQASAGARSEAGLMAPSRPLSTVRYDPPPRYPSNTSLPHLGGAGSGGGYEMEDLQQNLPSDDAILAEIREILAGADLMTVTKKSVKQELERRFGVALDARRHYIGSATEAVLGGQL
ncbi:MAG: hypothetical protein M1828_001178 [Chrysothrix sp. TS-e1954]|nr:MAG: hypothetical protein M1828_001178 [Chrysothrix sp. TS-e1954]